MGLGAFGRATLSRSTKDDGTHPSDTDSSGGIRVESEVRYSPADAGSYQLTSNPYISITGEETMGWVRTKFDRIGRVVEVTTYSGLAKPYPWGSNTTSTGTVTTVYNADMTTVTDQAGKVRSSYVDGLGRLVKVVEDPSGLNYQTTYRYDTLENLAGVCHGGVFAGTTCGGTQSRSFTYSSLGRLVSAINPESGTVTYAYDDNGNLHTRAGGGVTTTMAYDARNRVTGKSYSDGTTPIVSYCYDGSQSGNCSGTPTGSGNHLYGRLTMVRTTGTDTRYEQYDALGRVTQYKQVTDGVNYGFSYSYNLADGLTLLTYPSSRQIATSYNSGGRANGVGDFASSVAYAPFGGMTSLALALPSHS